MDASASFWQGLITLWMMLTALAVAFVAWDIRHTPEDPVLKWGFVIMTVFSGPVGAFLYILGCREPLPGTHEAFVQVAWRQVLGSTLHCVAGDGVGIVVAAAMAAWGQWPLGWSLVAEYGAGFLFGWTIFQALFMRHMAGGSYRASLRNTVWPEFLSMNGVMAGMAAVMIHGMRLVPGSGHPTAAAFWFVMGLALTAGLGVAYPINAWLVHRGLKHGMMTVRPHGQPVPVASGLWTSGQALRPHAAHSAPTPTAPHARHDGDSSPTAPRDLGRMTLLTLGVLALGIGLGIA
ncbi:MAG: DUF4396 domain-containing protein [Thermaerobacter sp.]|nr:DUF4396 domain-containing protein [Thermaerobacter sp.]